MTDLTNETEKKSLGGSELNDGLGKWFSVKDRLPNIADNVLAYRDDDEWQVICFFTTDGRFIVDLDTEAHAITHWMPLPEPPNG